LNPTHQSEMTTNGRRAWLSSNVIAIAALGLTVYVVIYSRGTANAEKLSALSERLAVVETSVKYMKSATLMRGIDAAALLHEPDPKYARRDLLLEKFMNESLTDAETNELMVDLSAIKDDVEKPAMVRKLAVDTLRSIEEKSEQKTDAK
jgi:hypothetical protein